MTREEIENTPKIVDFLLGESVIADSRKKLHKRMEEICNLAIQALEQESILDKIRAEIENFEINGHIRDVECFNAGIRHALTVIDKYKVESEYDKWRYKT